MSKKQYEDFLVELFFEWAKDHLKPGEKIHFKSPDDNNSLLLYQAFCRSTTASFLLKNEEVRYFVINKLNIIPVLHADTDDGYSENYISLIRDLVSGQKDDFKNSVLLIIHNSSLDTLNNSSKDLSVTNNIWNPKEIYVALENYIRTSSLKDEQISKHLLNHQFDLIQEDGATMFGFRELFTAVQDGKIDFNELGYLNDTAMESWSDSKDNQIEHRLSENKKLKDEIDYILEQFPTEYKEKLVELDFSDRFIDSYFSQENLESWKSKLDYGVCLQERKKNSSDLITFQDYKINAEKFYNRTRGESSSKNTLASRDHHLIIEVPLGVENVQFEIEFANGELATKEVQFGRFKNLISAKVKKRLGNKSVLELEAEFNNQIQFLNIDIKRAKPKECFKFRVLLVPENTFSLGLLATKFLVNPRKKNIILQTDESNFQFDATHEEIYNLKKCSEIVDVNQYGTVNFEDLLVTEDFIDFTLKKADYILNFEIQGVVSVSSLKLPLIFNQEIYSHFFDDDVNGVYNASSTRISLLGREYKTRYEYKKFLDLELEFVEKGLLANAIGERPQFSIAGLTLAYPRLGAAYSELFSYFKERSTLLSLASWGDKLLAIVEKITNEYVALINSIQTAKLLSENEKMLVNLGFALIDNQEYLTPLHPINLTYFQKLVHDCKKDISNSFATLPATTIRRLNAEGLIPFNWHIESEHKFSYSQVVSEHPMWIAVIPQKKSLLNYTQPLVRQKTSEFVEAFKVLFNQGGRDTLLINSIHNGNNEDLFLGLIGFIKKQKQQDVPRVHVCIYDDKLSNTYFDIVADAPSQKDLKYLCKLGLNDPNADQIADLVRRNITYSKFEIGKVDKFNYSHISFVRNNTPVKVAPVDLSESKTGIACNGLLAGETSYHEQGTYFTTAGLKGFPDESNPLIKIAKRYSALSYSAWENQNFYESNGLSLKVTSDLQALLEKSYEDSLWTVIIDPKVTLDFFKTQHDVVLIHYSDNYTNSSNYDAITVTKRRDLYDQILGQGKAGRIDEFNAFNGEWLLKMLTLPEKDRREKASIIAAYKYVNCLLFNSDITWVPLSIAEMIRVSGNIGLKMSESDFSTYCQGKKYGVMSDDVLFVGFKDQQMYLLPLEVKVGQKQKHDKGIEQAKKLKGYFENSLLGREDLAGHLYRGLFIKQIMMQVEKYQLYQTYPDGYFDQLLENRETLLQGNYKLAEIQEYLNGFVVAFIESDTFFKEDFEVIDNILMAKIPGPCQHKFISTPLKELLEKCKSSDLINIPEKFILRNVTTFNEVVIGSDIQQGNVSDFLDSSDDSYEAEEVQAEDNELNKFDLSDVLDEPEVKEALWVHFGENALTHEQLYWEPTNTAKFMNTNTGIIGTMGTGKTQFTKSLITQLMQNQAHNVNSAPIGMLIFDYKSDYVDDQFVEINAVKRFKLYKLPYNPLSLFGDTPMLPVHTARGFSDTMAKAFGLGVKQQATLRKLVLDAYEHAGIDKADASTWHLPSPTIKDVWNLYEATEPSIDSLYAALESLNELEIFESDNSKCSSLYDLLNGILVVELAGYPPQVQSLVVALTLDLFYSQMQKNGKPQVQGDFRQMTKIILVDEADNFMSQDFPSLRKVLKEGREYGVGIVLSTQDITHFKTGENNYSAYILTWVIHRVSQISNSDIKSIFNIDDKSQQENLMETIRKLDKHYSLYIDGQKNLVKMKDKAFWELCQQLEIR